MERTMRAVDDQQVQGAKQKKPYETPRLKKLGSVEQVTQGVKAQPVPDIAGISD